jgi:dihydrofolate reductase
MGKVVVTEFVTLDGVMEDPGGAEGFEHGGWAFEFERGDDGDRFKLDEIMDAEAHLLGRLTYEGFAAAWPSREGDFADRLNNDPKYVVSSTLEDPEWNNTTVLHGDVGAEVGRLRDEVGGNILVAGSRTLVQALLREGLVDELRLMVFPVVLGKGKRLFGEGLDKSAFRLVEARPVGEQGVLVLVYQPT